MKLFSRAIAAILAAILSSTLLGSPAFAHSDTAYAGWTRGFDFAWSQPSPAQIRGAGGSFVMVYISPTSKGGKHSNRSKIDAYRASGIQVGLIYETSAGRAKGGCSAGTTDAYATIRALDSLGLSRNTVVYSAAIDFDVTSQFGAVDSYVDCQAAVRGKGLVGIYAEADVISREAARGYTRLWQTYAWSNGRWSGAAILRQVHNGYRVSGNDTDLNYTLKPGYVGFIGTTGIAPVPYVPAVPSQNAVPVPATTNSVIVRKGDTVSGIARAHGTTVAAIKSCSRLANVNKIHPGQQLCWGGGKAAPAAPAAQKVTKQAGVKKVVAHRGDSLSKLAPTCHSSVKAMARANGLHSPYTIYAGRSYRCS